MGTHNRVMSLGEGTYLELIAIDPDAPAPTRPRWFDLDNHWLRSCLIDGPHLITWVARVPSLSGLQFDVGTWGRPLSMERDSLRWLITVPDDGRLPGAGLLPTLIEWQSQPPVAAMPDYSIRLKSLTLRHPASAWLSSRLSSIGADRLVDVEEAYGELQGIEARLTTPAGEVVLG